MDETPVGDSAVELVRIFLRAQNLEQIGRTDEAIELYERCVQGSFDSSGPYNRLIMLYANLARHGDVVRVADVALTHVKTHEEKRQWFERMRTEASAAMAKLPRASPKKRT